MKKIASSNRICSLLVLTLSLIASFARGETSPAAAPAFHSIPDAAPDSPGEKSADKSTDKSSAKTAEKTSAPTITGVVRIIRANPETEVFFKDLKDSYVIGRDSKHNELYEACEHSRKTGTPVSFQVDPRSRRLLSIPSSSTSSSTP